MEYNKLVRDRIPEIIREKGETPVTHIADDREYGEALREKLHEEIAEFLEVPSAEEAADILEVLHALCAHAGVDLSRLDAVRDKKRTERGGFVERIILERTEKP